MATKDTEVINGAGGEIVLYQPDERISLEVKLEEETVWLTQAQMVELFGSSKANISEHIANIYLQGDLPQEATVRNFRTVRKEGSLGAMLVYNELMDIELWIGMASWRFGTVRWIF